jgi:hypothetical protein
MDDQQPDEATPSATTIIAPTTRRTFTKAEIEIKTRPPKKMDGEPRSSAGRTTGRRTIRNSRRLGGVGVESPPHGPSESEAASKPMEVSENKALAW